MNKTSILIPALLVLLLACDKQESETHFFTNKVYTSASASSVQPVKLYTRQGELTDTALIRAFVNNNTSITHSFRFGTTTELQSATALTIHFTGNQTATVKRYTPGFPPAAGTLSTHQASYSVKGTDQVIVEELDSVTTITLQSPCNELFENSFLHLTGKRCIPGTSQICTYAQRFPIQIRNGSLVLPQVCILVKSGSPASYCTRYNFSDNWNQFNPGILSQLQPGDTIAVQVKELPLTN